MSIVQKLVSPRPAVKGRPVPLPPVPPAPPRPTGYRCPVPAPLAPALEVAGLALLVLAVFRLSRGSSLIRRIRFALAGAALLAGVLAAERHLSHPGREAVTTASLAVLLLVAVYVFLQLADHVVWEKLLKPKGVHVPRLLFDVLNFIVLGGVGLALLKALYSVDLTGFLVTSTVLSAILGLSLQDVLASFMSGIALQIERPFAVTDWIRVGDEEGQVVQMNWRTITLRSRDGHNVVLPNSRIAKENLAILSRPSGASLFHATVGVGYAHPPGDVRAVLAAAIEGAEGICEAPAPEVFVKGFADSAIEYDLRFWVRDFARAARARDAVLSRAWYGLHRAGMAIPFPQREVAVRQVVEGDEARRADRLRRECAAVLRSVETFNPLSDEQVEVLARDARPERFTDGERLVRQGDEGRSLFVVKAGRVRVEQAADDGVPVVVARMGPGSFFGEMSLLTGEPRNASVYAEGELEVTVVDKESFATVLQADHRLAEALSEELERRSRLAPAGGADRPGAASPPEGDSGTFFARIQRFFRLEP